MKKPKLKLDSATIQTFLVRHVEKIVLVLVVGVMVWLVYQGYALPGLESGKTPDGLRQASQSATQYIDDPNRWMAVRDERLPTGDLVAKVREAQQRTDAGKYLLAQPWNAPNFPKLTPRQDPAILPPLNVIVVPIEGPLAVWRKSMDEVDPLLPPPDPDAPKPVRPKSPPPSMMEAYDPYGAEGGGAVTIGRGGPATGRGAKKGRTPRGGGSSSATADDARPTYGAEMMGSSGMMTPEMMGSGMMGGGMMGGGMMGAAGLNPESIVGFQGNGQTMLAKHVVANVVMAVVPFEQQHEEFFNALKDSLDYDANRDQPNYLMFYVERAEISPADPDTLDWKAIPVKTTLAEQIGTSVPTPRPGEWAGVLQEVCDPAYLDPAIRGGVLTHPAPPFLQRDTWKLLTHPDVPLQPLAPTMTPGMPGSRLPGAVPGAETPGDAPAIEEVPTLPSGMAGGSYPGGGYDPSGGSSMMPGGGMMQPGGGYPGVGSGMPGPMMGGSMMGGSMMGGDMMGGSSGYPGGDIYGGGMGMREVAPPKYKLIRFTDTKIAPGKSYRYRISVLVNDPNNPGQQMAAPLQASLDEKVRERIRLLQAEDAKKGPKYKTFWRQSPWSEPSEAAQLPVPREYYAGTVTPPVLAPMVEGKPRVSNNNPKANVLTKVFDRAKIVDVPFEQEVSRGSVLNFEAEKVKVIHPVTRQVVELEKHPIRTNALVADIQGGEKIPPLDRKAENTLAAPGEVLVVDPTGKLFVQNESDDIESFRRYLVPKEDPNKPAMGAPGMMPGDGMMSDGYDPYADMMSAPGGAPARGRRARGGSSSSTP
jgi:hypothetical protein